MIDRAGWVTLGVAVGAAINIGLCAALIPTLGAAGAAIAASAGLIVTNVLLVILLWRRERIYSPGIGRSLAGS
jgi:O-antigen/teichoic acid export membrane protein